MRNLTRRYGKDLRGKEHTKAAQLTWHRKSGWAFSYEADFWSVGVFMCFLLVGRFPFDLDSCTDDSEIRDAIFWAPFNLSWDQDGVDRVDSVALDFMERMLKKASTRRLTVDEMKGHPYFDGVDFEKVKAREYPGPWPTKFQLAEYPNERRSKGWGFLGGLWFAWYH